MIKFERFSQWNDRYDSSSITVINGWWFVFYDNRLHDAYQHQGPWHYV